MHLSLGLLAILGFFALSVTRTAVVGPNGCVLEFGVMLVFGDNFWRVGF